MQVAFIIADFVLALANIAVCLGAAAFLVRYRSLTPAQVIRILEDARNAQP